MLTIFNFSKIKNLLHNIIKPLLGYFLCRKNIIILTGNKGVFLYAFIHNKLVGSLFISLENQENLDLYKEFFQKFKKFYVFFLLNNSECKIRHEVVPVLHSLVKTNPVEKFIEEYFSHDNIVGYNVYQVSTKPSEIWNTLIVSTIYTPLLSKLLDYVILDVNLKFGGIYFFALEVKTIIDQIITHLRKTQISRIDYTEYLQIFVSILKSNGIKLIVKHKHNIISIQTFDFPVDKSDSYIQGIIEQEVEDCLLESKNYIENFSLKVCIIIIVNDSLNSLLTYSKFGGHQVICCSNKAILDHHYIEDDKFSDYLFVKLFNMQKNYPAYNKDLKTISKLNIFSSIVFKPLIIIIITLITSMVVIKINTLENYKKLVILNSHYSNAGQEYHKVKQQYPYIQKTTNLADLYIFEALLQLPIPIPFDLLENFVRSLSPNLILEGMKWSRLDLNNTLLSPNQYTKTEIFLKFIINNTSTLEATKILKQQIADYTSIFGNMEISLTIFSDQIVNLSNRVVIPVSVIISIPVG